MNADGPLWLASRTIEMAKEEEEEQEEEEDYIGSTCMHFRTSCILRVPSISCDLQLAQLLFVWPCTNVNWLYMRACERAVYICVCVLHGPACTAMGPRELMYIRVHTSKHAVCF